MSFENPQRRWRIIAGAAAGVSLWGLVTYLTFDAVFQTAWWVAHMRPFPDGMFPEGWLIYAWLAAYTIFGVGIRVAVGRFPAK